MGYEVYLPSNLIGSNSKATKGEYVAIPWQKGGEEYNEKGRFSVDQRGRFSVNSLNIFLVVFQYIFMFVPMLLLQAFMVMFYACL